jgi:hypothetical protein
MTARTTTQQAEIYAETDRKIVVKMHPDDIRGTALYRGLENDQRQELLQDALRYRLRQQRQGTPVADLYVWYDDYFKAGTKYQPTTTPEAIAREDKQAYNGRVTVNPDLAWADWGDEEI